MRIQPTREQLQEALLTSQLPITLDLAMRKPAVALALTNTALALAARRARADQANRNDHKRRAAADYD